MTDVFPFACRTDWPLFPNKIIAAFEELQKKGQTVLNLIESNPTRCHFRYLDKEILEPLTDNKNLFYNPTPQGNEQAREAIRLYYEEKGLPIETERIFLTASTSEAYSYLFRLLTNPQDRVLFPQPSYPLFQYLADLNDIQMDTYPLKYVERWYIDFDSFKKALHTNTRAIALVNPNNPTGSYLKKEELKILNEICRERKIAVIGDEVFSDFSLKSQDVLSLVNNEEVLTFVLGGISKTLGLPQMKLSWIILNGPKIQVKEALGRLEIIADTYLSVTTPTQNAVRFWLSLKNSIQVEIKNRLEENLSFLKKAVQGFSDIELLDVEGGWYATLKIPATQSEEEWITEFLTKDHVFVHPGYFFDFDKGSYVIVSLLTPPDIFEEGIGRLLRRVRMASS